MKIAHEQTPRPSRRRDLRRWAGALLIPGVLACQRPAVAFRLEPGVLEDGTASSTWTDGIAVAIGRDAAEALESERRPLTPGAAAWLAVLEEALPGVEEGAPRLASLFDLDAFDAIVVAGNRGSSDGFGWIPNHIGINVQAFDETYGHPDDAAVDRMTRLVLHEYIHLLTYAFYPDHMERRDTPLNRALWTMFHEGIGDYVSVSERWLPGEAGAYSPVTARTLRRLEPIFVERLEAFVDATPEEEAELREGISMGKFDEKWGSLPVALWLRSEASVRGERETLVEMIRLGPDGVLPLALRHASPELRPRLEALAAAHAGRALRNPSRR